MPTGLSGFSTPRSNRRRTPTSSGRRGFNPLERISDIFSPQSPSFSQASPNSADIVPDDKPSDSSCSDSSVGGSVKEPFAEQVERLDQLLATPIGALAVTSPDKDYRSDDDLDDEVEGLESSRRLLAEELSRVDFSLIGKSPGGSDKGIFRTAESIEKSTGEVEAATPSLPKRKLDGTGESDIDWVPLLESEAHHAPNFSPIGPGQDADTTPGHSTVSPTRSESHSNATVYLGDEYFSPSEDYDEHEEEDKKPAAKPRQTQDKKMLDIFSRNDKGKNKKIFEGKKYSSLNSPTKTFRVNTAQGEKIIGKRNPTAEDSLSKKELDSISPISKNTKEEEILRDITSGSTTSPQSKHERLKSADDDLEDSLEGSPAEVYFPGAVFNPFGISTSGHDTQSPAIDLNSVSGESSVSLPSSVERKKNIYQSFLSFAKRYNSDGRYLEAGETPTKNFDHSRLVLEHLNTIFTNKEGEQSGMQRNQALTSEEESSANKKEQDTEKQLLFTLLRDQDLTDVGEIGLSSTPQNSQEIEDSKEIASQEMQAESDLALQSSIMEGRSNPKATKNVSTIIDSKSLKSKDTSSIIPILNDDSDNDVLFHIDSPQSVVSLDISAPAPGDNVIGLKESKITKNDDPTRKHHTSKSKWKRGLLIIGVLSLIIGLGLVIGTIAFPTREETQASTPSITLTPTQNPPIPSGPPSEIISFPSSQRSSLYPSTSPSKYLPVSPTPISSVPSLSFSPSDIFLFPSRNNQIPSNLSPPAIPSEDSSSIPTPESSEFQTTPPSTVAVTTVFPSEFSLIPSLQPSTNTPLPSSHPSGVQSENPSNPPSLRRSQFPSTSPSKTSSFPSLRPSSNTLMPSTLDPSQIPSTYPSTSPTQIRSEQPSLSGTISFTVPYKIFIANGLVEFVPQSEYIPELTKSMDLLTDDILLNVVAKKKRIGLRRRLAEVVLPTSITGIFNIDCPVDIENSLCQEVFAKISLLDGEDIWQLFEVTTELAVEIGRLQYYLEQVDPYSPVEIIDALWDPETQDIATDSLQQISTSSPTTSTSAIPTSSLLLDFLGEQSFDDGKALNNSQSPQFRAYSWLLDNSDLNEYSEKQLLQRYSLATLYYATSGDQWLANTFWLSNLKECYWFGRTGSKKRCNKKGELIHLELDLNNLKGSLPPELGLLSSALESITLSGGPNSDLVGTLPSELGHLTRLKVLNVRNNDLSGTIPFEIENLKRLEKIDLSQNRFRGEIPTQIGALSNLRVLDVSLNYLSGNLPTELGRLKRCQTMSLEDNILVSTIPTEIGKLRELKLLKAGFNEFALLPTELGALKSVDFISFQNCSIAGTIPTELGNLRKLRKFNRIHLNLGCFSPRDLPFCTDFFFFSA